jgi:hypothetical protein
MAWYYCAGDCSLDAADRVNRCVILAKKRDARWRQGGMVVLFLDRTVAVRRQEANRREHDWDDPGQPGNGMRQLGPHFPDGDAPKTAIRRAYITSSSGRSRVRPVHESGTVRQGVIRNRAEPSQAHRAFRPMGPRSHREVTVATAATRTQSRFPAGQPRQKVRPRTGGTRKEDAAAGSERTWQSPSTSSNGAVPPSGITPLQS